MSDPLELELQTGVGTVPLLGIEPGSSVTAASARGLSNSTCLGRLFELIRFYIMYFLSCVLPSLVPLAIPPLSPSLLSKSLPVDCSTHVTIPTLLSFLPMGQRV